MSDDLSQGSGWLLRTIIVPDGCVQLVRDICLTLAGKAASGMFTTALSYTGDAPPTHWISSGLITRDFADLIGLSKYNVFDTHWDEAGQTHITFSRSVVITPPLPQTVFRLAETGGLAVTIEEVIHLFEVSRVSSSSPESELANTGLKMITLDNANV